LLFKHSIKFVGLLPRKMSSLLRSVMGELGERTPGVYSAFYECGQVYIGQTGRSVETRITEHHRHERLGYPNKTAVAEHRFNHNHLIKFQDTQILSNIPGYVDQLIREAVKLKVFPNNMNRKEGLNLSGSWKPPFRLLRESRRLPQQR